RRRFQRRRPDDGVGAAEPESVRHSGRISKYRRLRRARRSAARVQARFRRPVRGLRGDPAAGRDALRRRSYLTLLFTLSSAACAQTSSLSPPGAPDTEMAPMISLPTLIGSAPRRAVPIFGSALTSASSEASVFTRSAISPLGTLYLMVV